MSEVHWQVAVNAPLFSPLTYTADSSDGYEPGQSVKVPLGKRTVDAVVLEPGEPGDFAMKNIIERHPENPTLSPRHLSWAKWLAQYYQYPIGQVGQLFFPPLKRHSNRKSRKKSIIPEVAEDIRPVLTDSQAQCISAIKKESGFSVHLLHGVTGSGKTEVYLNLLEELIAQDKQGLVLVPEISLTPQLLSRFAARFGPQVAAIHSHLTEREKTDQWWAAYSGEKKILIGARSALFCPMPNLSMIIIDEEHEPSFKQEEKLKYHARDAAVVLAQKLNCPVVLGSATPSLETWQNCQSGKYHLQQMPSRVANRALPEVKVIDLKKDIEPDLAESVKEELPFWMGPQMYLALKENYEDGKQAALFLNRRGIAQTVTCPACGDTRECPNCAVSLTLHGRSHLVCHYCDYHENKLEECSVCHEGEPTALGLGTELIENDLQQLFPEAAIIRADRDQISNRQELEDLIEKVENNEVSFLVGTQMIAKGLDFPNLKLVGLVLADIGFNLPDFRSSERAFQLVTQMSGRAGRHVQEGEKPGQVIVQTYNPEHPSLTFALNHDFEGFAELELAFRRSLGYPPFGRLASIRIQGRFQKDVDRYAHQLSQLAQNLQSKFPAYEKIQILGPAEAPLAKLRGQYRYHCMIKSDRAPNLVQFSQHLREHIEPLPAGIKVLFDIDPAQLL